jgi:hypothetical protein
MLSVSLRIALFDGFPIFLTNDSNDYLQISEAVYEDLDFFEPSLGDWRLPGYPMLLAFVRLLSRFDSNAIVVTQKAIGFGCVLLGLVTGYLLRSQLLAEAMVFFLGLNPVYLLNEHLVMAEAFFLLSLLGLSAMALLCLQRKVDLKTGIIFGIALGVCILTRASGLVFCAPLVAGVILLQFFEQRPAVLSRDQRLGLLRFLVGISAGAAVVFGPWLWRNYLAFDKTVPLTYNRNITLVVFLSQHGLLDASLPQFSQFAEVYDPEQPYSVYNVVWQLRRQIVEGEPLAESLVHEQLADHPRRYAGEMLRSLLHFLGYPASGANWGVDDVYGWFRDNVSEVEKVQADNASLGWHTNADSAYVAARQDTLLTRIWSKAGTLYLWPFRGILYSAFSLLLVAYLLRHRGAELNVRHLAIVLFSFSYLFNATIASLFLADHDRYSTPYDWALVMVIALLCSELWRMRRAESTAAPSS